MKRRSPVYGFVCVALTLGAGCSSSQMSRIDRHRDIYETWPLEIRQAVLDGKVEPGMNPDMVVVAWGKPSEVATSPAGDEIWVYKRGGNDGSVYYPGGGMGTSGIGGVGGIGGTGVGIGGTGTGIGISTGRGGTVIGSTGGIGMGGGIGGVGVGGVGGMGGIGGPIITPPTPPDVREVVFRNGVVTRADPPFGQN
jgi:hypothetical protein